MSIARVHTLSCLDEVESSSDTRAAAVIQESCHRAGWQSVWIHDNHLAVTQNSDVDDGESSDLDPTEQEGSDQAM